MKTNINVSDYTFSGKNNPKFQISDDPVNKLVRVIEIDRAEYAFDIDMISIKATTYYIDNNLKIVVFTAPTLVEKKAWDIVKGDFTIEIDSDFEPVANPDFDASQEISAENYPYMLTDAYFQFKEMSIALNMPLLEMFVNRNDEQKVFD